MAVGAAFGSARVVCLFLAVALRPLRLLRHSGMGMRLRALRLLCLCRVGAPLSVRALFRLRLLRPCRARLLARLVLRLRVVAGLLGRRRAHTERGQRLIVGGARLGRADGAYTALRPEPRSRNCRRGSDRRRSGRPRLSRRRRRRLRSRAHLRSRKRSRLDDNGCGRARESDQLHRGLPCDQDSARKDKRRRNGCREHESNNKLYDGRPHVSPLLCRQCA